MTAEFEQAIAQQFARYRSALRGGMPRAGWKICVNDPVAQHHLGLAGSFVGYLDGRRGSLSGQPYSIPAGCRPAVEAEIAIRIGKTPDISSPARARASIDAVAPALEIVDYALASRDLMRIAETGSFHHGYILGDARQPAAAPRVRADCPAMSLNGSPTGAADPRLVPEDLGEIVTLVGTFLERFEERLLPGDWILSGSCVRPAFVSPGDEVSADFDSLGIVRARFTHD